MYHIIYLPTERHLGCVYTLKMMNEEATVKITCELLNANVFSIHLGKYHGV